MQLNSHAYPASIRITSRGRLDATVRPPGSKSLINRHLFCAALADEATKLVGVQPAADVLAMVSNLKRLGIGIEWSANGAAVTVAGCAGLLPESEVQLDAGEAGTVMRFLTALVTLGNGHYLLDGAPRMRQRPIGALVDALGDLGAAIAYEDQPGFPPLRVMADGLTGGQALFRRPESSQFVSALLMAAPYAMQDVFVRVHGGLPSRPYVDVTLDVMHAHGVDVLAGDEHRFVAPAGQRYAGGEFEIEPDASSATYFWAAAAISGGRACVEGLTRRSRQADVAFVERLAEMGCTIGEDSRSLTVTAPQGSRLRGIVTDMNALPDAVQTLAVVALFAEGPTEILNVANLRIKETDRIAALATELRKLGATADTTADSLRIEPPSKVPAAMIETYNDHRMAMSFALAGLGGAGIEILNPGCVRKSFPGYFEVLSQLRAE